MWDLDQGWYHEIDKIRSNCSSGLSKLASINVFQNHRSTFVTKLFDVINQSPKLEYYSKAKSDFKLEEYLNCTIFKYRSALTRLRISAHSLEIERGRYGNTASSDPVTRDHRFCRYCTEVHNLKVVESEEHALYKCPLYHNFRHRFLNDIQNESSTTSPAGAATISSNNCENISNDPQFSLSKFCYKIFKYRKAFHDHLDDYAE